MSGKRFQSRAKTVQKLGRDGLVEQNMATGEEKRVSQRTANAAFDRARPTEREDIRRPAVRGADTGKKRKQPRPAPERRGAGLCYAGYGNQGFCFPVTERMTNSVAIIRIAPITRQITAFCTKPAMMKLTKLTHATVMA